MRYLPYEKYKTAKTDLIGDIPDHWEEWKASHGFGQIGSGTTPKSDNSSYYGGETLWVTTSELRETYIFDTAIKVTDEALADHSALKQYPIDSVVIAMYGATIGRLGMLGKSASVNQACCVYAQPEKFHPRFFYFWLWMRRPILISLSSGGGQPNLNQEELKRIRVPLPPLGEQEQIAAFLDWKTGQIDALIAKKQALIEKLKEKRLAVITQAVTKGLDASVPLRDSHIPWLGKVPQHWDVPALKMRYAVELGKMLDEKKIVGDQLIPYLRNTDVQWDRINFDELPEMDISEEEYHRYTIRENDVLVCEGGEVGRAAIVGKCDEVLGYQKALHRLRAEKRNEIPRFIYYTLLWAVSTGVFSVEGASTIAHLTADQLRRYHFPQPPETEQRDIVEFLDQAVGQLEKMLEKTNTAITHLTEYRIALINAATTGKIDVRNVNIGVVE